MAASEHLHPELFHGTGHFFGEGETINPPSPLESSPRGHIAGDLLGDHTPSVYLSSSKDLSSVYASEGARLQGRLFGPVYSVEQSPDIKNVGQELKRRGKFATGNDYERNTFISHKPVKPKEIVGWGLNSAVVDPKNYPDG